MSLKAAGGIWDGLWAGGKNRVLKKTRNLEKFFAFIPA
jgi:hypothetical protein